MKRIGIAVGQVYLRPLLIYALSQINDDESLNILLAKEPKPKKKSIVASAPNGTLIEER